MATGYKLDPDYNREGPVRFHGVGMFSKGEATAVEKMGISEKEADALIKSGDLPLKKVQNAPKVDEQTLDAATPTPTDDEGK